MPKLYWYVEPSDAGQMVEVAQAYAGASWVQPRLQRHYSAGNGVGATYYQQQPDGRWSPIAESLLPEKLRGWTGRISR